VFVLGHPMRSVLLKQKPGEWLVKHFFGQKVLNSYESIF